MTASLSQSMRNVIVDDDDDDDEDSATHPSVPEALLCAVNGAEIQVAVHRLEADPPSSSLTRSTGDLDESRRRLIPRADNRRKFTRGGARSPACLSLSLSPASLYGDLR